MYIYIYIHIYIYICIHTYTHIYISTCDHDGRVWRERNTRELRLCVDGVQRVERVDRHVPEV